MAWTGAPALFRVTPALPRSFSLDVKAALSGAQLPGGSEASPTLGSAPEASQGRASRSSSASRSSPRPFGSSLTRTAGGGTNPRDLYFRERPVHWVVVGGGRGGGGYLLEGPSATEPLTLWGPQGRVFRSLSRDSTRVPASPPAGGGPGEWPRGADRQARGSVRAAPPCAAAPALLLTQGVYFYFYLGLLQP